MTKHEELIAKYERNRILATQFKIDYEKYLHAHNSWDKIAFFDSKITNRQYFDEFVRISDQEYSDKQSSAIKTITIQKQFLDEYINGLDTQYNNLLKIHNDIKPKISDGYIALE